MNWQIYFPSVKVVRALMLTAMLVMVLSALICLLPLHRTLVFGFAFDLLLTVPLFYYLLIRKTKISVLTVVPLSILMFCLASYLLPASANQYLDLYKTFALPLLELAVVLVVAYKIRRARKVFKAGKAEISDFYERLQLALREVMPSSASLSDILATEMAMFYYAAAAFKKVGFRQGFSYHRETGLLAIVGAMVLLVVVETVALHFLLMQWSVLTANILTFLSLYSLIFILALAGAAKHRPHIIKPGGLLLRFGLQETYITFEEIRSIERLKGEVPEEKHLVKLGMLENYNLLIRVEGVQQLQRLYGIRKRYNSLVCWVDDPQVFLETYERSARKVK